MQTSTLLLKIDKAVRKERVGWDEIPQSVVNTYEEEIAHIHKTLRGRAFKEANIESYNKHFAQYGYTK